MGLFNLRDNLVIIDPKVLPIPEFKTLWDRDISKNKEIAYKELAFCYYLADFNSPYAIIPENLREAMIKEDFIKDTKWKADKAIKEAIDKYKTLSESPTMRLVASIRGVIDRMAIYMNTAKVDDKTFKTIQDGIEKTTKTVAGLAKLEDVVRKEQTSETRIRGGKETGIYER